VAIAISIPAGNELLRATPCLTRELTVEDLLLVSEMKLKKMGRGTPQDLTDAKFDDAKTLRGDD
jgi:hypothetical protein